ncbi:MAG: PEP-CTERM sorting domain-containing protein [Phycisphaerales bacterium JB054]
MKFARVVVVVGAAAGLAGPAAAEEIVFTASMTLAVKSGSDTLGLGGSSLTFQTVFDATGTYVERFFNPSIAAESDSLTISGSTGGIDGSYTAIPMGVVFYPTYYGQWYGGSSGGGYVEWEFGGESLYMYNLTSTTSGIVPGDTIDASHMGTSLYGLMTDTYFFYNGDNTAYYFTSFDADVEMATIPLPTAGALAGAGVLGLGVRRRRTSL